MTLIYMQRTINHMHKLDPENLTALAKYGEPEVKEAEDGEKYFTYKLVPI